MIFKELGAEGEQGGGAGGVREQVEAVHSPETQRRSASETNLRLKPDHRRCDCRTLTVFVWPQLLVPARGQGGQDGEVSGGECRRHTWTEWLLWNKSSKKKILKRIN